MLDLTSLGAAELQKVRAELLERYAEYRSKNLKLDMTRGKPCAEQLALSMGMLDVKSFRAEDGTDCRNYGSVGSLSTTPGASRIVEHSLSPIVQSTQTMSKMRRGIFFA